MRDPDTGNSRGFGFISYDSFEASDSAIEVWLVLVIESYIEMHEINISFLLFSYLSLLIGVYNT